MQMKWLFTLTVSALALVACGGTTPDSSSKTEDPNDTSSTVTPEPIVTEFIDAKVSPSYPTISDEIAYTTYYFDSAIGSDSNDGLSMEKPKKSLAAASSIVSSLKENDPTKILFKAGSSYVGNFTLENFKAADASPLIVDVYGKDEQNQYCKIEGRPNEDVINVRASNIRLGGFELTSPYGDRGIHVTTAKAGAMKNIVIHDNYIHDVNFVLGDHILPTDNSELDSTAIQEICPDNRWSYSCGGIIFEALTPIAKGPSWYENVWIDDNLIERVARTGIWVFSNWVQRPGIDWGNNPYYSDEIGWYPHKRVNVRGNEILFSGGDGVILGATEDGFIEYNRCIHAQSLPRPNSVCAGIWSHSCKNLVFQFNEAAYTHTTRDGQGFDIDIGNSNVLFQYNYSHHNDGGGLLCCNTQTQLVKYDKDGEMVLDEDGLPIFETVMGPWHDITVKNNVFSDNNNGNMIYSGTVNDIDFSNNTIVMGGDVANQKVIDTKDFLTGIPGDRWNMSNNIFYMRKRNSVRWEMSFSKTFNFENNVYYNFDDAVEQEMAEFGETAFINEDPKFVSDEATLGYDSVYHFIPTSSKMFEGGIDLKTMLTYDLNGNDVRALRYFGAFGTAKKGTL